jgi:hypothetical protein
MHKDQEALQVFQSFAKIEVGEGNMVLFWQDRWINGRRIEEIAPLLMPLVPTRRKKHTHG